MGVGFARRRAFMSLSYAAISWPVACRRGRSLWWRRQSCFVRCRLFYTRGGGLCLFLVAMGDVGRTSKRSAWCPSRPFHAQIERLRQTRRGRVGWWQVNATNRADSLLCVCVCVCVGVCCPAPAPPQLDVCFYLSFPCLFVCLFFVAMFVRFRRPPGCPWRS